MRRIGIIAALSLLLTALVAVPALAQNPHFVVGPTVTFNANNVTATGSIAGLGRTDLVDADLIVSGTVDVNCTNRGGSLVEAQQDVDVQATASAEDLRPENGRVNFNLTAANPTLTTNTCPNPNWTPTVVPGSLEITGAELIITIDDEPFFDQTFTP